MKLEIPLAAQLGNFVADLKFSQLPPSVVDKVKAFINHAVTVAMVSSDNSAVKMARRVVLEEEGLNSRRTGLGQGATLWVDGSRATRAGAVFANAVGIAVNNQCDSYNMLTHPGVLIVPAGLAAAEGNARNGEELITALAAGYEVQCRCARDFIPSTPARGFRASPVYGILGCAATIAKLKNLDADRTTNAIALAASFAGGLIEGQRTGARDSHFAEAQAARSGIWAAELAAQGFQGPVTVFEGEGGFYNAFIGNNKGDLSYTFTGSPKATLGDIVTEIGAHWELMKVKFKIYPTPGFNQPVIWLGSEMTMKHHLSVNDIKTITLEMNYLETLYPSPRFPQPPSSDGTKFGQTDFILAYTLVKGDYPVSENNIEHAGDSIPNVKREELEEITKLQSKIEIVGAVGRECFAPRLTIYFHDGQHLTEEYHGNELMWDFAKDAKILRRFIPKLPIPGSQYDKFVETIGNLDTEKTVDRIMDLTIPR